MQCSEVLGMEGDTIVMQDIFKFEQTGIDDNGKILGELRPTGLRPRATTGSNRRASNCRPSIFGMKDADTWYDTDS